MRGFLAILLTAACGGALAAQPPADPERCLAKRGVPVEHDGKQYTLRDEACRQLFLTDPERYAQLFDALGDLAAAGKAPAAAPRPSLVPS